MCSGDHQCTVRASVSLVERERFPRYRPGETLHPGIEPLLRQLGVAEAVLTADFLRHEGTWVVWNGKPRFEAFGADASGSWRGFQAWRADFDSILLAQSHACGAEIRQPAHAISAIVRDSRVTGISTTDGPLHASLVVDATGRHRWLARQLGSQFASFHDN